MKRASLRPTLFLGLLLFCQLFAFGCDCAEDDVTTAFGPRCNEEVAVGDGSGDDPGDPGGGSGGRLLVTDLANSSVREFTDVTTLEGETQTDPPLAGRLTRLTRPQYLTLDPATGGLIVADEGTTAILFFDDPDDLEGDVPPSRILTGPATELAGPVQTYVDAQADELYVLDRANSRVLVFAGASEIDGEVAPIRRLGGPTSGITSPAAFIFRPDTEQLSVLNPAEILTFEGYRTVNGDPPPSGRFGGAATTFSNLAYGEVTAGGDLIVVDSGTDNLLTFEAFQFDQRNQAPTRIVSGSNTGVTEPRQFELVGDTLYLANGGQVLVFEEFSALEGNPFPDRRFSGLNPATQTLHGLLFF